MPTAQHTMPVVLMIDDEPEMLDLTSQRLEHAGYRVLTATDGVEGLRLARAHHPHMILLDVIMPEPDGYQVLRLLKSEPAMEDIPVVMLTANGTERDMHRSIDVGSVCHLVKPCEPHELLEEVSLAVERHQMKHAPSNH